MMIISSCTTTTTVRHCSDYTDVVNTSKGGMLILPPEVEVNTISATNIKTRMYDYEVYLAHLISERAAVAIEKTNLRAQILHGKDIRDKKLYPDLKKIRHNYDENREILYRVIHLKPEDAYSISNKIDSSATVFKEKTQSDILVFIDYLYNVKSSGAVAVSILTKALSQAFSDSRHHHYDPEENGDKVVMIIGFVQASTGKVLWTNMCVDYIPSGVNLFSSMDAKQTDIYNLDRIFAKILKPFMASK